MEKNNNEIISDKKIVPEAKFKLQNEPKSNIDFSKLIILEPEVNSTINKIKIAYLATPLPPEPTSIKQFEDYIKRFIEEIRYYCKKKLFGEAITLSNAIDQRVFSMNKKLKSELTDEINKKHISLMKPVY